MRPALAARLSRVLVGWYPRRWRDRYREEMLEVLDQHHPTARTVASLGASAVSARLDPAWRTGRLSLARLRRAALISAAMAAPLALVLATIAYSGQPTLWNVADPRRPVKIATLSDGDGSKLEELAFSPDGQILATARYDKIFLWDLASPARPRLLRTLDAPVRYPAGDGPIPFSQQDLAFSPRGNLLAAVTFHGTVLVYSLADPAQPARSATVRGLLTRALYPSGSPQPTETPLCATCQPASYAVAFTPDGHSLTAVVDREEMSANSGRDTIFDWPVTGSGTLGAVTVAARDVADFQPVIAPDDRTVLGSPPGSHAWHAWPLP